LQAVRWVLDEVDPPAGIDGLSAWEVFAGYLVLDALIGNTDRHQENWAVIANHSHRRLSPTFDHASSLGFQLDDRDRAERLATKDRNRTPEAYADRARSRFEGHPTPVEVAIECLGTLRASARDLWLGRCQDIDAIMQPIDSVPEHRMSQPARQFASRVISRNCMRLMSHPFTTV
jgi:hypothetical protein